MPSSSGFNNNNNYKKKSEKTVFPQDFLKEIVDNIPENGRFLDAGCGYGVFLEQLRKCAKDNAREDIEFFAFDVNEEMLADCKARNHAIASHIFHENLLEFSSEFSHMTFDYVFSRSVLFFFKDEQRDQVFNNLRDITKTGGTLDLIVREKRQDTNYPQKAFNDFSETKLRNFYIQNGFDIEKSEISKEKTSFTTASQNNLDNLYHKLRIIGTNVGIDNVKPNAIVETFKEDRDLARQYKQRNASSSSVIQTFQR